MVIIEKIFATFAEVKKMRGFMPRNYTQMERLRGYSSIFSRSVFSDVLTYNDFSRLNTLYDRYDSDRSRGLTYMDYIKFAYKTISKDYMCEYVYKNELINKLLLREYGTKNTVAISEFRVYNSIADLALFNGESKVFEIKTKYDTKKRLGEQLANYSKLFQMCYIVIPKESYQEYDKCISKSVGVIVLNRENGKIHLREEREAGKNDAIDTNTLMHSVLTSEYQNIVLNHYGHLPNVSCYDMFDECGKLIAKIKQQELQTLYINEIKKRKNNTECLKSFQPEIRQMCLSLNLSTKQYESLYRKLNSVIE